MKIAQAFKPGYGVEMSLKSRRDGRNLYARSSVRLLAENHDSVATRITDSSIVAVSQMSDQVSLVYPNCCLAVIADVRVVVNIASVINHIQVILKRDAVAPIVINRAGINVGPVRAINADASNSTKRRVVLMNPTVVNRAIVAGVVDCQPFGSIVIHLAVQNLLIGAGVLRNPTHIIVVTLTTLDSAEAGVVKQ